MGGFPGDSVVKESAYKCRRLETGLGKSPGGGNGNPLYYSCLGNPMDKGAWLAPWGCKESDLTEQASMIY